MGVAKANKHTKKATVFLSFKDAIHFKDVKYRLDNHRSHPQYGVHNSGFIAATLNILADNNVDVLNGSEYAAFAAADSAVSDEKREYIKIQETLDNVFGKKRRFLLSGNDVTISATLIEQSKKNIDILKETKTPLLNAALRYHDTSVYGNPDINKKNILLVDPIEYSPENDASPECNYWQDAESNGFGFLGVKRNAYYPYADNKYLVQLLVGLVDEKKIKSGLKKYLRDGKLREQFLYFMDCYRYERDQAQKDILAFKKSLGNCNSFLNQLKFYGENKEKLDDIKKEIQGLISTCEDKLQNNLYLQRSDYEKILKNAGFLLKSQDVKDLQQEIPMNALLHEIEENRNVLNNAYNNFVKGLNAGVAMLNGKLQLDKYKDKGGSFFLSTNLNKYKKYAAIEQYKQAILSIKTDAEDLYNDKDNHHLEDLEALQFRFSQAVNDVMEKSEIRSQSFDYGIGWIKKFFNAISIAITAPIGFLLLFPPHHRSIRLFHTHTETILNQCISKQQEGCLEIMKAQQYGHSPFVREAETEDYGAFTLSTSYV